LYGNEKSWPKEKIKEKLLPLIENKNIIIEF